MHSFSAILGGGIVNVPGSKATPLLSNGPTNFFLAGFAPDGFMLWLKTWGGPSHSYVSGLTYDPAGKLYCCGGFLGVVDFDPSPGKELARCADPGSSNSYISTFDTNGNYEGVEILSDYGNVIVGLFQGDLIISAYHKQVLSPWNWGKNGDDSPLIRPYGCIIKQSK
jgi:hypothetical protein